MRELTVTCLGQCGFLLDDGQTRIVTDPYLSDAVDQMFSCDETPWKRLYPAPTTLEALRPDAVLISHSHTDHMDPITMAQYAGAGGGALVCVPAPEVDRLDGTGITNIHPCRAEACFCVGNARVTPIPCAHTQLHTDDAGRFRELSYVIDYGANRVFFGGDMSLYDGLAARLAAAACHLLLLPVNGRDVDRTSHGIIDNTTEIEAAELAAALDAPYVPMHHDLYALNGCSIERVRAAASTAGARLIALKPMQKLTLSGGRAMEA